MPPSFAEAPPALPSATASISSQTLPSGRRGGRTPPPAMPAPVAGTGSRPPSAALGLQTSGAAPASVPWPGLEPRTLGTVRASVWGHAPCRLLRIQRSKAHSCLQGAPSREGASTQLRSPYGVSAMSRREGFVPGVLHWHAALLSRKVPSVLTRL